MAQFDKNGYNNSDFNRSNDHEQDGEGVKINEKAGEYMRELLSEKIKLNNQKFPLSVKLLDQEVTKVQSTGRLPPKDFKYLDVYHEKPAKVVVKVLVPIKEHPKFNFVGKLLGPKGNTLKQMQEETMCKMSILGRGSMRDRNKEEELRNSLDPKCSHLTDELHVEISALAPPAEAHARIAYALAEVKKYLIPDQADMMGPPPMRDMMDRGDGGQQQPMQRLPKQPRQRRHVASTNSSGWVPAGVSPHELIGGGSTQNRPGPGPRPPPHHAHGGPAPRAPPHGGPAPRAPPHAGHGGHGAHGRPMNNKNKVISILDRARSAMESNYSYDDPYAAPEPPVRGPPRGAPEPEFYYGDRYYEEEPYYKEEPRDYKSSAREVGTRRPAAGPQHQQRHMARASPYGRPPKPATKKRSQ